MAKYKKEFKTAEKFKVALGTDHDLYKKFELMTIELVSRCKELGDSYLSKFRMDWAAAETRVNHYIDTKLVMAVQQPDDEMVPIEEYPNDIDPKTGARMGDPWTNGKGHKVIKYCTHRAAEKN